MYEPGLVILWIGKEEPSGGGVIVAWMDPAVYGGRDLSFPVLQYIDYIQVSPESGRVCLWLSALVSPYLPDLTILSAREYSVEMTKIY